MPIPPDQLSRGEGGNESLEEKYQKELEDFTGDIDSWSGFISHLKGDDNFEALQRIGTELDDVSETHADFLQRTGLSLGLRGYLYENNLSSLREKRSEGESKKDIVIKIEDGEKFIDYLSGFGNYGLDEDKLEALCQLGSKLSNQITDFYDMDEPDDDFLSLVPLIGRIGEQYRRISELAAGRDLGVISYALLFERYDKAIKEKCMRERLEIDELNYEYGLDSHISISHRLYEPEDYKDLWKEILDVLNRCMANKNAHPMIMQTMEWLDGLISKAEHNFDAKDAKGVEGDYISVNDKVRHSLKLIGDKISASQKE